MFADKHQFAAPPSNVAELLQLVLKINRLKPYSERMTPAVPRSTLNRALRGSPGLSLRVGDQLIHFCTEQLAAFGVDFNDLWKFVTTGNPGDGSLSDLMFGHICHGKCKDFADLFAKISATESAVPYVISLHQSMPPFLLPESVLDRQEIRLARLAGRNAKFWRRFQTRRRDRLRSRTVHTSPKWIMMLPESTLNVDSTKHGFFEDWTDDEYVECDSNFRDAVESRNVVVLSVPDRPSEVPGKMLKPFIPFEETMLFGEDLLLKTLPIGMGHLVFQRLESAKAYQQIGNHQTAIKAILTSLKCQMN